MQWVRRDRRTFNFNFDTPAYLWHTSMVNRFNIDFLGTKRNNIEFVQSTAESDAETHNSLCSQCLRVSLRFHRRRSWHDVMSARYNFRLYNACVVLYEVRGTQRECVGCWATHLSSWRRLAAGLSCRQAWAGGPFSSRTAGPFSRAAGLASKRGVSQNGQKDHTRSGASRGSCACTRVVVNAS